jgi:hypothetical protein
MHEANLSILETLESPLLFPSSLTATRHDMEIAHLSFNASVPYHKECNVSLIDQDTIYPNALILQWAEFAILLSSVAMFRNTELRRECASCVADAICMCTCASRKVCIL